MTRLQLLERENKDLKIKNKVLKNEIEVLKDLRKEEQRKIDELNKKVDMLFAEIAKMSTEIVALKEENTVLRAENKQLREELNEANETIEKLKSRLKKDSTNSSKPSSTDGFKKKVHNFREKTGRKVGGQFGHKGHTLVLFKDPTEIINHLEGTCSCGGEIVYNTEYKTAKQNVDIKIVPQIIEHRTYEGKCIICNKTYTSKFPKGLDSIVEYGDTLKAFSTVLTNEGMVSINRTKDIQIKHHSWRNKAF